MGAGGLQAMVKSGLPIRGKRVVIAGTGPLLLAVAAYLRKQGAEIPVICEQASWTSLARFAAVAGRLSRQNCASVAVETANLPAFHSRRTVGRWRLTGKQTLESVTISRGGKS